MKKILLCAIALLMFTASAFSQRMTDEQSKKLTSVQMLTVVHICKPLYKPGMTYGGFLDVLLIPSPTFPNQDLFFKKVYSYLQAGTSDADILKSDNTILETVAAESQKIKANVSTFEKALHLGEPKKWWMIAINWVVNTAATVGGTLVGIPPGTIPPVDFWPNYGGGL